MEAVASHAQAGLQVRETQGPAAAIMVGFSLASRVLCQGARKKEVRPPAPADPHSRGVAGAAARTLAFDELATATRNFRDDFRIVGREKGLYKAYLKSVKQVVAIKHTAEPIGSSEAEQLSREFLARVMTLSALRHPNVVNLVGFYADSHHTVLVHEYMPLGSLDDHLHDRPPGKAPLDWNTRMNIAARVARGLEYLHGKGVVYPKSMSSSNILLGDGYHPKLSQCRLAEVEKGWCTVFLGTVAPETADTGRVTVESNVYSFGGLFLEMITGRRAFDRAQAADDRNLVTWVARLMKDRSQFRRMADPALQGRYSSMDLQEALAFASMFVHQQPAMRPPIGTVVTALSRLAYDVDPPESSHHAATR